MSGLLVGNSFLIQPELKSGVLQDQVGTLFAIISTAAWVLPLATLEKIEASTMRRPSRPWTFAWRMIDLPVYQVQFKRLDAKHSLFRAPISMAEKIASSIWCWYGQDEYQKVILLGELCPALEFLALDAPAQCNAISCCLECSFDDDVTRHIDAFLRDFAGPVAPQLRQALEGLQTRYYNLSEASIRFREGERFTQDEWQEMRVLARNALHMIGWGEIKADMGSLVSDCRAQLKKWGPWHS